MATRQVSVPPSSPEPDPAAYPMEVSPPDISAYREGNTGIPYAFRFDSGIPGPHVTLCAIVHGNEVSGAIVLDEMLRTGLRPLRGCLSLVFVNPAAYATFDVTRPLASRYVDEDMNRLWSPDVLAGRHNSIEHARAKELLPLIAETDALLDLHSMLLDGPPLLLAGPTEKGRKLALALGAAAVTVADSGHGNGTRLRDYDAFGDPESGRNAVLSESGQHWRQSTVAMARDIAYRFLRHHALVDGDSAAPHLLRDTAPPARWIEVTDAITVATQHCRFSRDFANLEVVPDAGTVIAVDGGREIRTPYADCVLVMPSRRLIQGHMAVRLGRFRPAEGGDAA